MARNDPQVNLRMPAELKDALEAAASRNQRSLTAEIVNRLQSSVDGGPRLGGEDPFITQYRERIEAERSERAERKKAIAAQLREDEHALMRLRLVAQQLRMKRAENAHARREYYGREDAEALERIATLNRVGGEIAEQEFATAEDIMALESKVIALRARLTTIDRMLDAPVDL